MSAGGNDEAAPGSARMSPSSPFMTVAEVAQLLRTTPKAIYAEIGRGLLAGVIKYRRRVLIDRATLIDSLAKRRATSLGDPER